MISLAIATHNEEKNIVDCIESCKGLVDEIIVIDGSSTDKTGELALGAGATVIRTVNEQMFHINKQKAIEACSGDWILQLDADERVTPELAREIKKIIQMNDGEIEKYESTLKEKELFSRHQGLVQAESSHSTQSGAVVHRFSAPHSQPSTAQGPHLHTNASDSSYSAFFIPRLNYFLGGYLKHGGVYPDGVIRLIRKGKAYLPCKDVHELMEVEGKTGWLAHPLIHKDSPTFKRYLERNSRYIDHLVSELKNRHPDGSRDPEKHGSRVTARDDIKKQLPLFIDWVFIKPISTFFSLLIRHKGILDGWRGVVFAFFSSIRFARAYFRFVKNKY